MDQPVVKLALRVAAYMFLGMAGLMGLLFAGGIVMGLINGAAYLAHGT